MIGKLLCVDCRQRLGCKENGALDVKAHKFFSGMDWERLISRQIAPPHKPYVNDEVDTSNFDEYQPEMEETPKPDLAGGDPFSDF